MQIINRTIVKHVLTAQSKEELRLKFANEIAQLDLQCQQLLFEKRKLINKLSHSKQSIEQRFNKEINRRKDEKVVLEFKLEQLEILALGNEIIEKEVDTLVEVEVGSNWQELSKKQSIIVKDGIVIRIDDE